MFTLDKSYNPKLHEKQIYALWEKSGFFNPDNLPARAGKLASEIQNSKLKIKNFCVIMPPPNANGSLHIGHAVFVTLQDIMIRYKRMAGFKTLWLPGADHAGFETQVVYDKKLEKEGRSRFKIPREQLYKEMMEFTLKNKSVMESQLKSLGASCDWSREKFTLDPEIIKIVYSTFEKLKKDGLVYKDRRIVNWCTKHQTSLSDLEVKYITQKDPLYYIKYGPIELATVRPETKFGDTAIAVNPADKRYKQYVGKEIEIQTLPTHHVGCGVPQTSLGAKKMKVIADNAIDMKFGTGAVKVTPGHDPADYDLWLRHKREIPGPVEVIDKFGRLNEKTGPYAGMKVLDARKKIVDDMVRAGLCDPRKTNYGYTHNVSVCYKCQRPVEPLLVGEQWFVKMTEAPKSSTKSLRDLAVETVRSGKIKFVPKRYEKVFFHWMKNLRDWNISRQITWGIPIPEKDCSDVFDTWFSSGQWPFATLLTSGRSSSKFKVQSSKLEEKSEDFKNFYPTSVMETGGDILFFWVARMIMLGIYVTGKIPFKTIYLHGLVRDKERQKMSKSRGNVIDPLGVIDLYGADALRMALVVGNTPGNDPIIHEEKIRGYQHFANKIWNASRFVLMNLEDENYEIPAKNLTSTDKKILKDFEKFKRVVTREIEAMKFYSASEKIYHYFWHEFCDKIIEEAKPRLKSENKKERTSVQELLFKILFENLKLLHPFMPFITETIYQQLPIENKKLLMIEKW